jgi:Phage integrase, N-terminal SAM-like domain/Phage integrase family
LRRRTVKSYTEAIRLFADFLAGRDHPLTVEGITRDDVRAFVADQLERWKPLTALNRYRGLQAFFKWAVAEGELAASPMAGMNPPQIPDELPPVLTDEERRRLLKACEGRDFADRRDAAILRLFLDTGVRVSEAAGIMLPGDLDLDAQVVIVLGKGPLASGGSLRPQDRPCPWTDTCACGQATHSSICRTSGRPGWGHDAIGAVPSRGGTRRGGRSSAAASASVPPLLCRLLAVGRRQRG